MRYLTRDPFAIVCGQIQKILKGGKYNTEEQVYIPSIENYSSIRPPIYQLISTDKLRYQLDRVALGNEYYFKLEPYQRTEVNYQSPSTCYGGKEIKQLIE